MTEGRTPGEAGGVFAGSNPPQFAGGPVAGALLVSVVIPTHNRPELLARAIESVRRQTHEQLEIIVVDDGSRDDTRRVVETFADARIRYLRHETSRGGGAARNTGVLAATGQFIAFLDDDDEWLPNKTEEQLRVLRDVEAVACASESSSEHPHRQPKGGDVTVEDLQKGPWGGMGVLMGRADVIKATMFDETLPMGQDWDFFIRLALKHRISYLNKPLLRYNAGDHPRITNTRSRLPIGQLERQLRVVHKHRPLFGSKWFRREMCNGMLYGIKGRQNKLALLAYTARCYGPLNVLRTLADRVHAKLPGMNCGRRGRMGTGYDWTRAR